MLFELVELGGWIFARLSWVGWGRVCTGGGVGVGTHSRRRKAPGIQQLESEQGVHDHKRAAEAAVRCRQTPHPGRRAPTRCTW